MALGCGVGRRTRFYSPFPIRLFQTFRLFRLAESGWGKSVGTGVSRRRVLAAGGLVAALGLAAALTCAAPAALAEADGGQGAEQFFGAIAYSPSTRAHGWAFDYTSRVDAEKRAMAKCQRHARDCFVPVWFRNACGALAIGFDGYGTGWGASRRLAETYALQSCRRYSGGCWVVRWVCTSK
jgi:hypothetical protein